MAVEVNDPGGGGGRTREEEVVATETTRNQETDPPRLGVQEPNTSGPALESFLSPVGGSGSYLDEVQITNTAGQITDSELQSALAAATNPGSAFSAAYQNNVIVRAEGAEYNYLTTGRTPGGTIGVDSLMARTTGEMARAFYEAAPDALAQYQTLLYEAGFLGQLPSVLGQFDIGQNDYAAWVAAVKYAAAIEQPFFKTLRSLAQSGVGASRRGGGGGGGGGPKRPTVQLLSKDDAEKLIQTVAQEVVGRAVDPQMVERITGVLHDTQRREQNAFIDKGMAGGGEAFEPTDVRTISENQLREQLETESDAKDIADTFANLVSMLGGGR